MNEKLTIGCDEVTSARRHPGRPGRPRGIYWNHGPRALLRERLRVLDTNGFIWPDNRLPYRVSKQIGIRISTVKLNGEGYLVLPKPNNKTP